jgi:glutaredoxin
MKQFLKQQGVDYREIDVSQGEAIEELRQKTGQTGVPVVEVGDQLVIGFDRAKLIKVLEAKGLI